MMKQYVKICMCLAYLAARFVNSQRCIFNDGYPGNCIPKFQCTSSVVRDVYGNSKYYEPYHCYDYNPFNDYINQILCCPTWQPPPVPPNTNNDVPPPTPVIPVPGQCGVEIKMLNDFLIGAEEAEITDHLWMALIRYTYNPRAVSDFHCAGSLINDRFVLTAASCVSVSTSLLVRLGEWDTRYDLDEQDGQTADPVQDIHVEERFMHQNYDRNSHENDIALLYLKQSVKDSRWIIPICLPTLEDLVNKNYNGESMAVAGWGEKEDGSRSFVKLKAELDVTSIDKCKTAYETQTTITDKQICAYNNRGQTNVCKGDGGSPLMYMHKMDSTHAYYFVAGVMSFGSKACKDRPGVFTRVDKYLPWIKLKMGA
ncbi:melanization protease 1-like [Contarinia nasturtii]|uniref:melanization protease 1-like n=1 Tax=Contarinia nasturtii TaxID=265458 RepID=UPI0012D42E81|nr:melanization protease 1-like [Contarinia nasturtii]